MSYKLGFVSQKGGVGKSTLARATATAYAAADWDVKIADLDIDQGTSYTWLKRRLQSELQPTVEVQTFGTFAQADQRSDDYDLMIFDGAPHATKGTIEIAKHSDLVVLPTGLSLDDLEPTVLLAHSLVKKGGIDRKKISFAICRAGTNSKEQEEVRDYLSQTPYHLLDGVISEKPCFRRAQDEGRSVIECRYKGPREQADHLIQSIMNRLEELTK
ncbi:hypothetical protein GZ77_26405 [Endozoicomonas montiporae]|uniref:CobQ/CobB/MinD/ParA nucleotide binding domain-containing protein n=1 Tax=Endozoicomonas montiporae TaxID=1027273 RepID=A0A081MYG2_9GAMM|nr:ParA family protein [Endozoicomonas montiporae]KEQ11235.1 hypothetical protein GZ77_26405 [Endozoicomonas montiporae]